MFYYSSAEKKSILRSGSGWPLVGAAPPPRIDFFSACETRLVALRKDALSVLTHGAHGQTVEAVVAAPARIPGIEAQGVREARVALVERRRPEVAPVARVVELAIPADARSGKENGITVYIARELTSVHTVQSRPFRTAVV